MKPDRDARLLHLAGFALAHAAWSVEDGETLCTMAMAEQGGERELVRYEADTIAASIDLAYDELGERLADPEAVAVLVFDGYATALAGGSRQDALVVELLTAEGKIGTIVQPYSPATRRRFLPFGRRQGFALLGQPSVAGKFGDDPVDTVLQGAREHDAARHLFATT